MSLKDLRSEFWGDPAWPNKFTELRQTQVEALAQTLALFESGVDIVIAQAPTGSGKTAYAEAVRRCLKVTRCLYVANTKTLQDQFMGDFGEYAKCLKGRSNYPTLNEPERFNISTPWTPALSAADCDKCKDDSGELRCSWCTPWFSCPYEVAKDRALAAQLVVTNTSYFVAEANGPGKLVTTRKGDPNPFPLVIVDEADTLEDILKNSEELMITAAKCRKYDIHPPSRKTVEEVWPDWVLNEALPKVKQAIKGVEAKLSRTLSQNVELETRRELRSLHNTVDKLNDIYTRLHEGNAVYDGYKEGDIVFRVIRPNKTAQTKLWPHANKWLLMSAHFGDIDQYVDELGINETGMSWDTVYVPSTFPVANRPIHVRPAVEMTFKDKDIAWPKMAKNILEVVNFHGESRTLIHSVSYEFSKYLHEYLTTNTTRPVFTYTNAKEREGALHDYLNKHAAILIASSMDRGVDLPYDACRVVIVAKCPYPNKRDKPTEKRMYMRGGQLWYANQTVRKLVQMTGRGVRSETDKCHTYILDGMFMGLYNQWKGLFPKWWCDALDMSGGRMLTHEDKF